MDGKTITKKKKSMQWSFILKEHMSMVTQPKKKKFQLAANKCPHQAVDALFSFQCEDEKEKCWRLRTIEHLNLIPLRPFAIQRAAP